MGAHAQGRLEVDFVVGSQTYLNDIEPDPGSAGTYALGASWQLAGPHNLWVRHASAAVGLQRLPWRDGLTGVYVEHRSVVWDQDNTSDATELLLDVRGEGLSRCTGAAWGMAASNPF